MTNSFRIALLSLFCLLTLTPLASAADKRPNILFIYADDQSTKTVGCYPGSYPWIRTPHIDALARSGIRFEGCYLGSWCMPSRATLLTGRLPHGIESMRMVGDYPGSTYDPALTPFWPSVFRKQGYHTAQIGKWHTGVDAGYGRDWDYQVVWNRPKHPKNAGNYYEKQLLAFNGAERAQEGYATDNYTDWACEYIRGEHRDAQKPWYLWLCYGAVHGPTTPAPRHVGHYKGNQVPPPSDMFPPRPNKPSYLDKTQAWSKGPDGEPIVGRNVANQIGEDGAKKAKTFSAWVQQVNECALAIDEGVGRVMAALKASGQLDNTIVIYSADQGFAMGEHGCRIKLAPYDANYRSPLIVSMPSKFPQSQVCPQSVNGPDLVVSFFELAGLELPWSMHGRSIVPLLHNPQLAWPHTVLYEHLGHDYGSDTTQILKSDPKHAVHNDVPWYIAIRQGRHKYIRYLKHGEIEEVYDLQSDPEELNNLAADPAQRSLLEQLRAAAVVELRRTGAGFADQMPATAAN